MVRLGDVFTLIRNGASIKQLDGLGGLPITRIETISDRIVDRSKFGYAGITDLQKYQSYVLQDGDILMSHINSEKHLGKVALYNQIGEETIIHGMNLLVLRADKSFLLHQFAAYYFNTQAFLKQINTITKKSVNQASFTVIDLKELCIPVPTLQEQEVIATLLNKVDSLIFLRKQQLTKLNELIKSQFIEMFGDGQNPLSKLEDICEFITKGTTPPTIKITNASVSNYIPYIKVYNLSDSGQLYFFKDAQYIDDETHNSLLSRSKVYPNDVLMNIVGLPLGKFALVPDDFPEWNINQAIAIFRSTEKVLPIYLMHAMMQPIVLRPFLEKAVGVRQINLSLKQCRELEIPLPPIWIQKRFVDFVQQADKSKFEIQQGLKKLEILKKVLMQQYFG